MNKIRNSGLFSKLFRDKSKQSLTSQSMKIDKEESDKYQANGLQHKRQGNYVKSQKAYHKAIELNYTDSMAYYALAKTYYLSGNVTKALRNYLCTMHLSLNFMIDAVDSPGDPQRIQFQRQMLETQNDKSAIDGIRQIHPYADLIFLDDNTPRHIAHVLVDLPPSIPKSSIIGEYIQTYKLSLQGMTGIQIDYDFDYQHYLPIGRIFALDNIQWISINRDNPYQVYHEKMEYNFKNIRELIHNLP
jgi:tetratricopeptide (TPR) repeat protein